MKSIYVECVQIHSCAASCSSRDEMMYKYITKEDYDNSPHEQEFDNEFKFGVVYIRDKTYDNVQRPLSHATKEQMDTKVAEYEAKGYSKLLEVYDSRQKSAWASEEKRQCEENLKAGKIFYTSPDWEYSREKAQGGFSDDLWNYEPVVKYTENHAFGYFGHSIRTHELDTYFEEALSKITAVAKILLDKNLVCYNYLSSSSARHFSDSIEGHDFEGQKAEIDLRIKSMWNDAYIFSLPEHGGTYSSTQELTAKYKDYLFEVV